MLITWSSAPLNRRSCTQCDVCAGSCANAHTQTRHSHLQTPHSHSLNKFLLTQSCEWRETPERVWEWEKEWQPHLTHHIHLDGENRLSLRTTRWGVSTARISLTKPFPPGSLYVGELWERDQARTRELARHFNYSESALIYTRMAASTKLRVWHMTHIKDLAKSNWKYVHANWNVFLLAGWYSLCDMH